MLNFNLFPQGKKKALTLSYDDGCHEDKRLVEIINRHHLKATFHLNTAWGAGDGFRIDTAEYAALYAGHEISCHGHRHPDYLGLPFSAVSADIMENRRVLESIAGVPMRGMSYPYGRYNAGLIETLRACGMEYSRTVGNTSPWNRFELPQDFMAWDSTCHHNDCLKLLPEFLDTHYGDKLTCMYVWGHAFEFERNHNWQIIEEFCEKASGRDEIWYATNCEIMDYALAVRSVKVTCDGKACFNPSRFDIWATGNNGPVCIPAGGIYREPDTL